MSVNALKSVFGILTIATALLSFCGTTAKGQPSQIYVSGEVNWNIGADSGVTGLLSVPQFNPALGVLDSVEIRGECVYSSAVTVSGPAGAYGQVHAIGSIVMQDPGNNINLSANLYGAWDQSFCTPSQSSCSGTDIGDTVGPPYPAYNSPAVLGEFTGNGNFSFQVTGAQSIYADAPGVNIDINDANLTANAYVTYDYTVVPEPSFSSLVLIGFGLMLTRRKSRNLLKTFLRQEIGGSSA